MLHSGHFLLHSNDFFLHEVDLSLSAHDFMVNLFLFIFKLLGLTDQFFVFFIEIQSQIFNIFLSKLDLPLLSAQMGILTLHFLHKIAEFSL